MAGTNQGNRLICTNHIMHPKLLMRKHGVTFGTDGTNDDMTLRLYKVFVQYSYGYLHIYMYK